MHAQWANLFGMRAVLRLLPATCYLRLISQSAIFSLFNFPLFGPGVSREPYNPISHLVRSAFVPNFETCDWSMQFMQVILLSSHWLPKLRPGWPQVAVQYCTNS
jgi:hypothetical protein